MNNSLSHSPVLREIADLVFPESLPTIDDLFSLYPPRQLSTRQWVLRFAPSPTGFMHLGGVYMALISTCLAQASDGVYFVRIEDTDQKRKITGAEEIIFRALAHFGLSPDEGCHCTPPAGEYGPYRQSQRRHIYQAFLRELLLQQKIYVCFCSEDELAEIRRFQERLQVKTGYYGPWARWRDAEPELVLQRLRERHPFVLRLRSQGDANRTVAVNDLIKGEMVLPENEHDIVVMKGDGLPTYHFAHAVDDRLMGTTHVIRADEWVSSVPLHFELFDLLGFKRPQYGHVSPINKLEGDTRRKLSKRKDPEANVEYFERKGYPAAAVIEYLLNLADSDFEPWRTRHPAASRAEFRISLARLANSNGPLFDETKLADVAKEIIARLSAADVYRAVKEWSASHAPVFHRQLQADQAKWTAIFAIERGERGRKDLSHWGMVHDYYRYFDNAAFPTPDLAAVASVLTPEERRAVCAHFAEALPRLATAEQFLAEGKTLAAQLNLAESTKAYRANPALFRGHVGEVMQVMRVALTGRERTPDLFSIVQTLNPQEAARRLALQKR